MDIIINADCSKMTIGNALKIHQGDFLLNFLMSYGYKPTHPPLGDLLRQIHKLKGDWRILEPIYWEATHNDAMIVARGDSLEFTEEEARACFKLVANFLSEESMVYHSKHLWLIKVDDKPELTSEPPYLMLHQSLMPALNKMDKTLYWQRLFTELQMFLSANFKHRMNKIPINGVWFYGGGSFVADKTKWVFTEDEDLLERLPIDIKPLKLEAFSWEENTILLINDLTKINFDHLTEYLSHYKVRWFWNNTSYFTEKQSLWNRLWKRYSKYANHPKGTT